jgi:maltooligosyltrehalose trehalohydrolase
LLEDLLDADNGRHPVSYFQVPAARNLIVTIVYPATEREVRERQSSHMSTPRLLGTNYREDGSCEFTVWAPHSPLVEVYFPGQEKILALTPEGNGYHCASGVGITADAQYFYRLNRDKQRADPASRFQPEGVFGPSQIVNLANFTWGDADWRGMALKN